MRIRSSFAKKLLVKQLLIKGRQIRLTVCVENIHLLKILKTDKLLGDLCQVIEFGIPGTIATNDVMRGLNRNSSVFDRLSGERERLGKGSWVCTTLPFYIPGFSHHRNQEMNKEGGDVEIAYRGYISRVEIWGAFTGTLFQNMCRYLLANLSYESTGVKL